MLYGLIFFKLALSNNSFLEIDDYNPCYHSPVVLPYSEVCAIKQLMQTRTWSSSHCGSLHDAEYGF